MRKSKILSKKKKKNKIEEIISFHQNQLRTNNSNNTNNFQNKTNTKYIYKNRERERRWHIMFII